MSIQEMQDFLTKISAVESNLLDVIKQELKPLIDYLLEVKKYDIEI